MSLFLTKSEQGIIVFHIWKNLKYSNRLIISLILIAAGITLQYAMFNIFPGIILVFAGNLFLLVKGYDKRIKLSSFDHTTEWTNTDLEHLEKVAELNKKAQKWDISAIDITNGLGFFILFILIILMFIFAASNPLHSDNGSIIIIINIIVLLFPHWVTGVKRITTAPALVNKIKLYQELIKVFNVQLQDEEVSFLMLLKGKDKKMPADVKMKIKFKNQPEDFLGMYAQISLNNVQGKDYPYFYVVLVAKKSANMFRNALRVVNMPKNVICEQDSQDDADVFIIRQFTTRTSGYYTNEIAVKSIFETGIATAKKFLK